jgi:hypothetical protein
MNKVKQASKVDLGLWCQDKRPQPLLDRKWLDLLQQRVTRRLQCDDFAKSRVD